MNDDTTTATEPAITEQEREKLKARHDELSRDIRKTAMVLLTYCFFCFLTLGQSDEVIVSATAMLKIPFASTEISPRTFLWAGPLILILLSAYLHVFIREHNKITSIDPKDKLPYIFNLDNLFTKGLTVFTFYLLPGIIMLAFAMKVYPRPDHGVWHVFAGVSLWILFWIFTVNQEMVSFRPLERIIGIIAVLLAPTFIYVFTLKGGWLSILWVPVLYSWLVATIIVFWFLKKTISFIDKKISSKWIFHWVVVLFDKICSPFCERSLVLLVLAMMMGMAIYGNKSGDLLEVLFLAIAILLLLSWVFILIAKKQSSLGWRICRLFSTASIACVCMLIFYSIVTESGNRLNLRGAELFHHDLNGYFLSHADLQDADLRGADLRGADLKGAKLSGAKLSDAKLRGAKLDGAKLDRENLKEVLSQKLNLKGVNLSGLDLIELDFHGINLQKVNFRGTKLNKADLRKANLEKVNFRKADLRETKLQEAKLKGAELTFSDFRGAEGLTVAQVKQARNWHRAFYDNGLRKALGVTDNKLIELIEYFVGNRGGDEESKDELTKQLLKYYGLPLRLESETPSN